MYFALQEITSLAKDDERRKRKKDKRKIVQMLWAKGMTICSFSRALLNSSFQRTTNNDVKVFPLA